MEFCAPFHANDYNFRSHEFQDASWIFLVKYQCQTKLSSVLVQVNWSECTDLVIAIIQESEQATALVIAKHTCENKNIYLNPENKK